MSRSLARDSADGRVLDGAGDRLHRLEVAVGAGGKPASMTSTFSRSSWRAMRSFSSLVMEAPGDCSPSRSVVSKMISWSAMRISCWAVRRAPARSGGFSHLRWPRPGCRARCRPETMALSEADTMLASMPTPNSVRSPMRSSR
jgi:hypothetical protein